MIILVVAAIALFLLYSFTDVFTNDEVSENTNTAKVVDLKADTDGDGLIDVKEDVYGTDINKADTDGDGYTDFEEVEAGFNPLGEGDLYANKNVNTNTNANENVNENVNTEVDTNTNTNQTTTTELDRAVEFVGDYLDEFTKAIATENYTELKTNYLSEGAEFYESTVRPFSLWEIDSVVESTSYGDYTATVFIYDENNEKLVCESNNDISDRENYCLVTLTVVGDSFRTSNWFYLP